MNNNRFQFALDHVLDKSVVTVERDKWEQMIDENGEVIKLINVPLDISRLNSMAAHVMTAGSGIHNSSPGIDVVRYDPADKPYIYNIDHYTVFENFTSSPLYQKVLEVACIEASDELFEFIEAHVFIVGPYKEDNHWVKEIPIQIREARSKKKK
jgi:hypothetical protein